jgi:NAD(P)-dependent dehydrogenase (short-subunit alcohol dehydrogenase family)
VQTLVADTVAEHGRLDYTFNNAAATATRGEMGDLPLAAWHRAIDVNLLGVLHGTIAAYSVMLEQGFGHIASIGLVGYPTSIPYSATKAAVVNLSLSLRMEA